MPDEIFHQIDENSLRPLLGCRMGEFYTKAAFPDLRFSHTCVYDGRLDLRSPDEKSHFILSMSCKWEETDVDLFDYHRLYLTVEKREGKRPEFPMNAYMPDDCGLRARFPMDPLRKITVFGELVESETHCLHYDGYLALYYGDRAFVIGTRCDMSDFLYLYLVPADRVQEIMREDLAQDPEDDCCRRIIRERVTLELP